MSFAKKLHLFTEPFQNVAYLVRDEFKADRAAGAVDSTAAEPGPGTRGVTDVESKVTISSNALQIGVQDDTPAWGDEGFTLDAVTRTAGRMVLFHTYITLAPANGIMIGLGDGVGVAVANVDNGCLNFSTNISYWDGAANYQIFGAVPTSTDLYLAFVMRDTNGVYCFMKTGSGYYELMYFSADGGDNPRPKWTSREAEAYMEYIRVPRAVWIPTPSGYDTFTRDNGAPGSTEATGPEGNTIPQAAYIADHGTVVISGNETICTDLDGGKAVLTIDCDTINVVFDLDITNGVSVAGHVLRYVDQDNYLLTYHDGANFRLVKRVGGVESNVISAAKAYAAGATGRVIADGTSFFLYYNGSYVGNGTCADAVLQTSTKHGLCFHDVTSTLDNLLIFPRGTEGEYQRLANFNWKPSLAIVSDLADIETVGRYDGDPVIECGAAAASDEYIREIGNVLYEPADTGKEYKTWYTGYGVSSKIHYAYSSDGITWTKSASNPVINNRAAEDPYVVKVGETYYLYAEDKEAAVPEEDIRYWTSADGETWVDQGQIVDVTNCASPVVWKEGATWYMLYENYPVGNLEIYLATSADGETWVAEPTNPVMAIADNRWGAAKLVPDDIYKDGATYYMLYHGEIGGVTWKSGIATSANLTEWTDMDVSPISPDAGIEAPTMMIYYDDKFVIHYYYDTDESGILRGYPCKCLNQLAV